MDTQEKGNGKVKGHDDRRKYKYSIIWGSGILNKTIPETFHKEMY